MTVPKKLVRVLALCAWAAVIGCASAGAEMATISLKPTIGKPEGDAVTLTFDVMAPLGDKRVLRAELALNGGNGVEVVGLKPLAPWYNSFDVTELTRRWAAASGRAGVLQLRGVSKVKPESIRLLVTYEGKPANVPPQVKGLNAFHRAGQTFITFQEIDDRSADASPRWADLKTKLDKMDAEKTVRYLVFRHGRPITAKNVAQAELLARVKPMSGYNVRGRSVDELITIVRKQAVDDAVLARRLARTSELKRYTPNHPAMAGVPIGRLAIEDGKPLPPKTGLYVHHPDVGFVDAPAHPKLKAYYAVVASVDGVANTRDFAADNSLAKPVDETVGAGVPVLQGAVNVTVFFDYPGQRLRYVQWAALPLANLPNQYYNWGVFVPRDYGAAGPRRLSIFFHDGNQRYLKMPWPHRQDRVIIAPHDAPFPSFGIGYNNALGTLRPLKQGVVRPFFRRRVDAVLEWATKKFDADTGRISCGGGGYWGGTAALQYGIRRPGRIAYVMADGSPDPDPARTPDTYVQYPWRKGRPRRTPRGAIDRVWGRPEWKLKAESGKTIWEEAGLPAFVRAGKHPLPYLSLGSGSMSVTWKQQTHLMIAYKQTGNAFMSQFYWGGTGHIPLPAGAFEPRTDRPMLACWPLGYHPNAAFFDKYFFTGVRGYGGGSRLNNRIRWESETIVDTAEKLEMTIYSEPRISYAGSVTAKTTVRNAQNFKPAPGEKLKWSAAAAKGSRGKPQRGEITVDKDGLIVIPSLTFTRARTRLIVAR